MHISIYKIKKKTRLVFIYCILIIFLFIFTVPFYYMFVLASRSNESIFDMPPPLIPGTMLINNLNILFEELPFARNFLNSIFVTVSHTVLRLFFCALGGFALAKYRFKSKPVYFALTLITLMIPRFFNIIPLFKMMVWFHWTNTYLPLIIPGMADAFGIFLMSQFMMTSVSDDLLDAGRIDGLNEFKLFFHIGLSLSRPALFVLGTITFISTWNDFLWPYIILTNLEWHTIPVALSTFNFNAEGNYGAILAANLLATLPLLIIFLAFSKNILKNLVAGSIKG